MSEFDSFEIGDLVTAKKTGRFVWRIKAINAYNVSGKSVYFLEGAAVKDKVEYALEDEIELYAKNVQADEMLGMLNHFGEIPIVDVEIEYNNAGVDFPNMINKLHLTLGEMVMQYNKTLQEKREVFKKLSVENFECTEEIDDLLLEYAKALNTIEIIGEISEDLELTILELEEDLMDAYLKAVKL